MRRFLQGRTYRMVPRHGERVPVDPLNYRIEVVPDLHPTIEIDEQVDSAALSAATSKGWWAMTMASRACSSTTAS
ncbi:MAG: hypothetical protein IPL77_03410 [Flavobacteriales bacterium]|nr:hypothetical protein [Flavobacteriales bacterium]